MIIGSLSASPPGRNQAGKGYVVFGTPAGAAVELSEVEAGLGGFAIHGAAVWIISDRKREPSETFTVRFSNAVGTPIDDGVGTSTIVDND